MKNIKVIYILNKSLNIMYIRRPFDSILEAVLTVSPNRQYLGILWPTTPATQGPGIIYLKFIVDIRYWFSFRFLGKNWYVYSRTEVITGQTEERLYSTGKVPEWMPIRSLRVSFGLCRILDLCMALSKCKDIDAISPAWRMPFLLGSPETTM